jgi:hypothetical protein
MNSIHNRHNEIKLFKNIFLIQLYDISLDKFIVLYNNKKSY